MDESEPRVPVQRSTARVLLRDEDGRLLLFTDSDPGVAGRQWWITPGGGVEPGESLRQAALRETREETGLLLDDDRLIGPVAHRTGVFHYSDRTVVNDETYFTATVPAFVLDTSGHTEDEQLTMLGHRWWSVDELAVSDEDVQPPGLADLLARLDAAGVVELGRQEWHAVPPAAG